MANFSPSHNDNSISSNSDNHQHITLARNNKELAKRNSLMMARITNLENKISELIAENMELRKNMIEKESEKKNWLDDKLSTIEEGVNEKFIEIFKIFQNIRSIEGLPSLNLSAFNNLNALNLINAFSPSNISVTERKRKSSRRKSIYIPRNTDNDSDFDHTIEKINDTTFKSQIDKKIEKEDIEDQKINSSQSQSQNENENKNNNHSQILLTDNDNQDKNERSLKTQSSILSVSFKEDTITNSEINQDTKSNNDVITVDNTSHFNYTTNINNSTLTNIITISDDEDEFSNDNDKTNINHNIINTNDSYHNNENLKKSTEIKNLEINSIIDNDSDNDSDDDSDDDININNNINNNILKTRNIVDSPVKNQYFDNLLLSKYKSSGFPKFSVYEEKSSPDSSTSTLEIVENTTIGISNDIKYCKPDNKENRMLFGLDIEANSTSISVSKEIEEKKSQKSQNSKINNSFIDKKGIKQLSINKQEKKPETDFNKNPEINNNQKSKSKLNADSKSKSKSKIKIKFSNQDNDILIKDQKKSMRAKQNPPLISLNNNSQSKRNKQFQETTDFSSRRRTRGKSINYTLPSLRAKMRRPDPLEKDNGKIQVKREKTSRKNSEVITLVEDSGFQEGIISTSLPKKRKALTDLSKNKNVSRTEIKKSSSMDIFDYTDDAERLAFPSKKIRTVSTTGPEIKSKKKTRRSTLII
ncbi:uncharacterized protein ASCRUDRAFT_9673 [Ascoidea rubescens DSM 1968]|uniref:Shugoshin C-terminal domain-containing protein n=1 Tax=Ascoidea rubescens DSM 1968 TaxID=1344418 RepID=A0A1D2VCC0_9ASCO|nr:hypothetical protein ASCRUDRAFT_9673 [Ascoidea rubescens DSM 1968]ODV59281.1 hypothetical protein ASCRUDRAFT_9673 [Ascoidea rubescens DSM 1968]